MFQLNLYAVPGIPLFVGGEDVGETIVEICSAGGFEIADRDVIVIAQKLVSKSEYRVFKLEEFTPSAAAIELSQRSKRDARLCEAYLRESTEVVQIGRETRHGLTILTRHRSGILTTGAGIDQSNISASKDPELILLPEDSDASARLIRRRIRECAGKEVAVIINDSYGRMDRHGSMGMAIGFAGIRHLEVRSQTDIFGKPMTPQIALVDELSSAASILMGQGNERCPVVVVRGAPYTTSGDSGIGDLIC
jgi:coenzyme F420-0:L-glutamate ligase/coenzyme F420-1:gamma-L-glutamate ligase